MTGRKWLACNKPEEMLSYLVNEAKIARSPNGRRKLRLLACGCCRQVWPFLMDKAGRHLVEMAESYADGLASVQNLAAAADAARSAKVLSDRAGAGLPAMHAASRASAALGAAVAAGTPEAKEAARIAPMLACCAVGGTWSVMTPNPAWDAHEQRQVGLFRCLFGNPFRPVLAAPAWLTGAVLSLATAIYDERAFDRLPILADALEDAGCTNADILNHCRQPGDHVRGCWCVDLVLGKT